MGKVAKLHQQQTQTPAEVLHEDARGKFADHVQSVAFHLTLSRRMIAMLRFVRDDPGMFSWGSDEDRERDEIEDGIVRGRPNGPRNWLPLHHALEARGLVYRSPKVFPRMGMPERVGHRPLLLTRAGELCCELLVEAGLMPRERLALPEPIAKPTVRLKRRAAR